jgi:hypothetical protein
MRIATILLCLVTIPLFGTTSCPTDVDVSALTITIEGEGTVEPCCTGLYRTGEVVRLTAKPAYLNVFTGWRSNPGQGQSTNPVLDVVMDRDKNIIARFDLRPPNPDDLKAVNPDESAAPTEAQPQVDRL